MPFLWYNTTIMRQTSKATTVQFKELVREVGTIRSLLISMIGQDAEGRYRPEFVRGILNAGQEKTTHTFRNATQFLRDLKSV